ncbi:hypothetical protein [Desulfopila inferna]|uniref:hypothetical protein n=1 Tax=Desulfopila inferna TaxID=468528 RepID=UPI001966C76F|nr:hypothetical protein [Desulfopila inferna]MBM9603708.1 hypothetical protein [Desulfopila inferna]
MKLSIFWYRLRLLFVSGGHNPVQGGLRCSRPAAATREKSSPDLEQRIRSNQENLCDRCFNPLIESFALSRRKQGNDAGKY